VGLREILILGAVDAIPEMALSSRTEILDRMGKMPTDRRLKNGIQLPPLWRKIGLAVLLKDQYSRKGYWAAQRIHLYSLEIVRRYSLMGIGRVFLVVLLAVSVSGCDSCPGLRGESTECLNGSI
jgi:hypothetical protein